MVKHAIDGAATRRAIPQSRKTAGVGLLSMHAGEVFAAVALADAMATHTEVALFRRVSQSGIVLRPLRLYLIA